MKCYDVPKLRVPIKGTWKPSGRSKSKYEHFSKALALWPYLFNPVVLDEFGYTGHVRADFDVDKLASILSKFPDDVLGGSFEEWGQLWHNKELVDCQPDMFFDVDVVAGGEGSAQPAGTLKETINIALLRDHIDAGTDKKLDVARAVYERFRLGRRSGDFCTLDIQ